MKTTILTMFIGMFCLCAEAQIPQPDPDTTAKHFITVASIGNLQEVSAGQLAVDKAKHADVRSFGQMMIMDHRQSEEQLRQLATRKGYSIPREAAGGIQPDLNLKNATDNFDAMYIHAMLSGHGNTVQMFETYATTGNDPEVRAFAKQMLPTLKTHLAAIKALDEKYKTLTAK